MTLPRCIHRDSLHRRMRCVAAALMVAGGFVLAGRAAWAEESQQPAARPPLWAEHGAYVYRVSTPDAADVLPKIEAGSAMVSNLLDGSVPQILILNGIIGHDHPGPWNWDGVWPYWNRVTFRANNDFGHLADFMARARKEHNVWCSFHVNLTDVNVGLRDYPETRAFFKRLVDAKAIYRRDRNPQTNRRDVEPPYVPQKIPESDNPVEIFALVNYKRFWDSGLAKQMIDEFYAKLPYAPPLLYLDVLNLSGGNFSTGFPDGPLGGSEQMQLEGAIAIIDYLRSKGTDLATEGPRPEFGDRAGYVWLHGKGFSADDYHVIFGGNFQLAAQHVLGNPGAFNLSPIASTSENLNSVRAHYAALLAGKPGTKDVPGADQCHVCDRRDRHDEFDIPGTGDPYRGDWADVVNNFYMTTIQELYHIGNRATRRAEFYSGGVHLGKYVLTGPGGEEVAVSVPDFVTSWQGENARKWGQIMLETPIATKASAPRAGRYQLEIFYKVPGRGAALNVYVNERLYRSFTGMTGTPGNEWATLQAGDVELRKGENVIAFDVGPIRATWTDGTVAEWTTPYLRKGFKATCGELVLAEDYDRMWPDTWSGQRKIYFFSWDGTSRTWKLPKEWAALGRARLYPLTPDGRGDAVTIAVRDGSVRHSLLPQVPYVLVPGE